MGRGGCRAIQCLLEVINVLFIVIGITLIVTGAVFVYTTIDIPGPASTAAICAIVLGFIICMLGSFGYTAAQQRKILGKEFKGKIKLIVYAVCLGTVLMTLLGIGIVLFVWLGGTVPDSGYDSVNDAANSGIQKAEEPVHNFVGCVYDVCCITRVSNKTAFNLVSCKMDTEGVPDVLGAQVMGPNTQADSVDPTQYERASKSCEKFENVLNRKTCEEGSYAFRQAVGQWLNETIRPLAVVIIALSVLILIAWVFAVLEIFWCCGESDLPAEDDDPTKVYPEDDYDDYDDDDYYA